MLEKKSLNHHAQNTHRQRRQNQRCPVVDTEQIHHDPGGKRAQHVQRAMGKINDAQQAKNHGQSEAQHGVESAIDQAQQQLA